MTTQEYIDKLKFIVATFEECWMRGDLKDDNGCCLECEGRDNCEQFCRLYRTVILLSELKEEKI